MKGSGFKLPLLFSTHAELEREPEQEQADLQKVSPACLTGMLKRGLFLLKVLNPLQISTWQP